MYLITLSCKCDTVTDEPAARSVECAEHGQDQRIRYVEPLATAA